MHLTLRLGESVKKRTQRLQTSLEQDPSMLRTLVDNLPDGIFLKDRESRFIFGNQAVADLMGIPDPSALQGKTDHDFYPKKVADTFLADERIVIESHKKLVHKLQSGKVTWLITKVPALDSHGEVTGLFGISRDITDAEEALRMSEQRYRDLLEQAAEGIYLLDENGDFLLANPEICKMLGYTQEELLRLNIFDTYPEELREDARARNEKIKSGQSLRFERTMKRKDGSAFTAEVSARRLVDGTQQSIARDISERKRAEETLRESEARFRTIWENSIVGTMLTAPDGRVFAANPAACLLFGRTEKDICTIGRAGLVDFADKQVLAFMKERVEKGYASGEITFVRADGTRFPALCSSAVFETVNGTRTSMVIQDISELKNAHASMRNLATHLLYAREEERRKIAQEIHDDLGQTLAALKMDLHWISKRLGGDVSSLRDKMKETIELGAEAINTVQRVASDLRPKMLDDLGLEPALEWLSADFSRRTKIACKVTVEVPSRVIGGNAATTLYRIIQEALTNIGWHSKADHADVRLIFSDGILNLEIEDSGIGITAEQVRAPNSYGLIGLRERVEGLGGIMSISGEPGSGTIVRAHIPVPKEGGLA